jgi:hypothetical protein
MNEQLISREDVREEAYLYDLYVSPQWRETFNELLDAELKLPDRGRCSMPGAVPETLL